MFFAKKWKILTTNLECMLHFAGTIDILVDLITYFTKIVFTC